LSSSLLQVVAMHELTSLLPQSSPSPETPAASKHLLQQSHVGAGGALLVELGTTDDEMA